jgi:guanylate kinase
MSNSPQRNGLVFVLVGPSGAGKNTLMRQAIRRVPALRQLPTATTRPIRADEKEGREHFFLRHEAFKDLIDSGRLLEHQVVHNEWYGIIRETIETAIEQQEDLIADIEVLGASVLLREYPDNAVLIFVAPPTRDTLETRIRARGHVSEEEIARRMQRVNFEMQFAAASHYLIINDNLEQAIDELIGVIAAERSRRNQQNLAVSVLIVYGSEVLGGEDSTPQSPLLPGTLIQRGEEPVEAARRLVREIGVEAFTLLPHSENVEEGRSPVHFEIVEAAGQKQLRLIFACEVVDPPEAVEKGWQWKPLETVPLAPHVYRARLQSTSPRTTG